MGQYTFTWSHPAQEVYVTGDFDNWSKSIKLDRNGDSFHKTVTLPGEESRIHYKFVVDGNWTIDNTARQETDHSGNVNNVVEARELSPEPEERPSQAFISSVHPQSTTAALAGQVPLEKERNIHHEQDVDNDTSFPQATPGFEDLPGQFPVTPMADLNQFMVNPIPATEGPSNPVKLAPGEPVPHPSTLTSNTIHSTVRDDPELKKPSASSLDGANESRERGLHENDLPGAYAPSTAREEEEDTKAFGVNPIPATSGLGNPIKLAPGEPVPHHSKITSNTIQSTVRDGSQYGVSDTGAPVLPPVLDSQSEAEANGASMFNLPAIGGTMIPESSLPMGGGDSDRLLPNFDNAFTSSAAPQSTTAQLAGQVPLEPRGARGVPEVVSESQQSAHVGPEAAANPEAVREKAAVESELKQTVPETNANNAFVERSPVADAASSVSQTASNAASTASQTASNTAQAVSDSHVPEYVAGGLAAAGATAIGAALLAKDKLSDVYQNATEPTPASKEVPDVVTESQERARVEPEASASPVAVREKAAFEDELKHSIPQAPATSESGVLGASEGGLTGKIAAGTAAVGTAAAGLAYAARDKATDAYAGSPSLDQTKEPTTVGSVPEVVTESQERAHVEPEASASPVAVREKAAFEDELKHSIPQAPATSESGVLGASEGGLTGKIAAGTAAFGAAAAGLAYAARDKATDAYTGSPLSNLTKEPTIDGSVPEVVTESQERAHVEPEASASPEAVREKTAMEGELLSEVSKAPATSESGVFGKSEQGVAQQATAGVTAASAAVSTQANKAYESVGLPSSTTTRDTTELESGSEQVPEIVQESQDRAHVEPEASANPEAVHEKSDMENELLSQVNKAPATSESGVLGNSEQGITGKLAAGLTAGAAAIGATAAGAAYATRDKASDLTGRDLNTTQKSTGLNSTSQVPEVVQESQERAHVEPEAAANVEAVHEKSDVEKELLAHVHKAPATSESGVLGSSEQGLSGRAAAGIAAGTAAFGATAAGVAYTARDKTVESTGRDPVSFLPPSVASAITNMNQGLPSANTSLASPNVQSSVPEAVVDSQHQAHVAPEASAEPAAVAEKSQVERELLDRVPRTYEAGKPAPTESAALSATAPVTSTDMGSDMEAAVLAAGGGSAATASTGAAALGAQTSRFDDELPRDLTGGHSAMPTSMQPATTEAGAFTDNTGLSGATTSTLPIRSAETSATTATTGLNAPVTTGLNAPAESQAQIPAPVQSDTLAAPTLEAPAEKSRDVSPMTRPDSSKQSAPQVTTGTETHSVPATSTGSAPTTPQRSATKRSSGFFRGTPQSDRTSVAGSSKDDDGKGSKKRGFLAKLKEKFRG